MSVISAMNEIERLPFAARIGLANSFQRFLRNISRDPIVVELLEAAKSSDVAFRCLQRVQELSKLKVDFRYLHRYDIALATYLWILLRTSSEYARIGAGTVANVPRTWWADQVSRYILEETSTQSSTATDSKVSYATTVPTTGNISTVSSSDAMYFSDAASTYCIQGGVSQATSTATKHSTLDIPTPGEDKPLSFDTSQRQPVEAAELHD